MVKMARVGVVGLAVAVLLAGSTPAFAAKKNGPPKGLAKKVVAPKGWSKGKKTG